MSKKSLYKQGSLFNQTSFEQLNLLDELTAIEQGIEPLEPSLFNLESLEGEVEKASPLPLGEHKGFFVVEKISPLEFNRNMF